MTRPGRLAGAAVAFRHAELSHAARAHRDVL